MTDYNLIRSRRKTIAIHITKDAAVEVRAPLKVSKTEINRLVASKQDWINRHVTERKRQLEEKAAFMLNYGDTVSMQGRKYPITAKDGKHAGFDGEGFYLPPGLLPEEIKHIIVQVYKMIAKKMLTDKVFKYAKLTGFKPIAVKINGAKTHWGSCSGKNSINFSWRLIMADDDVIDYVVVHELAHTREHNHSDRFWTVVASVLPDYKERRIKLKGLQKRLAEEDWD